MIFPILEFETIVQSNDKTRFDASKSFSNSGQTFDTVTLSIDGAPAISIATTLILDHVYVDADAGSIPLVLTITSGVDTYTKTFSQTVLTAVQDNLFSNDNDIKSIEDDIMDYVKQGRSSHLDKHREAQKAILEDLDDSKIWKNDGTRYESTEIVVTQDFKEWSKYKTLELIFRSNSNQVDDIHSQKASYYKGMTVKSKNRAALRLDSNGDGEFDPTTEETTDVFSNLMVRR
jgi:hypothetical protein